MQTKEQRNAKKNKERTYSVPEEHKELLTEVSGAIAAIIRRNSAEAFALGYHLARVKEVLPEKSFGRWVKQACGFTTRNAWNYVSIYQNLRDYKERLEACAVSPTMMAVLASAEPAKIEEVLIAIENGERLTVAQVKKSAKGDAVQKEKTELGGAKGLLRAAEAKMRAEVALLNKFLKPTLKVVEQVAGDIGNGKHVAKTKLADQVAANCLKASDLLRSVISPVQSATTETVEWEKARRVIARLGDSPRWPGKSEFPDWVVEQVLPALRFVVLGTPLSGEGTENTANDIAAEAVERVADGEGDGNVIDDTILKSLAAMVATAAETAQRRPVLVAPPLVPDEAEVARVTIDQGETA